MALSEDPEVRARQLRAIFAKGNFGTSSGDRPARIDAYNSAAPISGGNSHGPLRKVFISFHVEDQAQVELLRQQAKDDRFDLEFIDYSVKEPFDEKWKTNCTERIKQSSVVFVMLGPETYQREAVLWEINKAYEMGKPVVGVRIYKDQNHKVPQPMIEHGAKIINWKIDDISKELQNS